MSQTRLTGRQRRVAGNRSQKSITAAFAAPGAAVPVLVESPAVAFREPAAVVSHTAGLPSPFAAQPRAGSRFAPGGPRTHNSLTLRNAMPRVTYSRKRARPSYSVRRVIPRRYGRGDYKDVWNSVKNGFVAGGKAIKRSMPTGTFQRIGTAVGGALGKGPTGALLGGTAGDLFSKLVGFGDYNVVSNSIATRSRKMEMGQPVAAFGNISNGTVVQHREYIRDIVGTGATTFSLDTLNLNPGLPATFPWLSALAGNYEQYEFRGMVFEYKSMCSDSTTGAASALGSVIIATDYDSIDAVYTSKSQMEQSQYCTSGKPSSDICHPIECAPNRTSIPINYIRTGAYPTGTDPRLYDLGKTYVALSGIPAASAPTGSLLGELWVTYEVVLYKPQIGGLANQVDHFDLGTTWGGTFADAFGTSTAIATARVAETGSNIGCSFLGKAIFVIPKTCPVGRYMFYVRWRGASTALTNAISGTLSAGLTALSILSADSTDAAFPAAGETAIQQYLLWTIQITAALTSVQTITLNAGTLPGTPASGDLFFIRLADNMS